MNKTEQIKKTIVSIPKNRFTTADVNKLVDASSALVNNTLKSMVDKGELKKVGSGRKSVYINVDTGNNKENKIQDIPVADRFDYIEKFTKMVGNNVIPSLLLTGQAGVGKTHVIINTLEKMNLVEGDDYIVVKVHSSPMGLYMSLYNNNGKIIVMDDCDSCWNCNISLNILKNDLYAG